YGVIPPHVNFRELNPRIDLSDSPFVIPTQERAWRTEENGRRFSAVSSFGLSGTNAHVVLEQASPVESESEGEEFGRAFLLPLSARSTEALHALTQAMHDRLDDTEISIRDLCYSASLRRSHHEERIAVVGGSREELQSALKQRLMQRPVKSSPRKKIVFVFS